MPVMSGFGALEKLPWERINDKIERRVLAGKRGMIVWWKIKAGAHAGAHQHPHEQIVWMLKGKMEFRSAPNSGSAARATSWSIREVRRSTRLGSTKTPR